MSTDAHWLAGLILAACWVVFTVFWAVTAFHTKRTAFRQGLPESIGYRLIAVAGACLLFFAKDSPHSLGIRLLSRTDPVAWLAAAFGVLGLGLCLWARVTLGRNWSNVVTVKEGHELVRSGPYRYVRHPIYSGILLMFTGIVLLNGRWGGILGDVLLLLSFWIKLRQEEVLMLAAFPEDYPLYMKRVKRLIPFVL